MAEEALPEPWNMPSSLKRRAEERTLSAVHTIPLIAGVCVTA